MRVCSLENLADTQYVLRLPWKWLNVEQRPGVHLDFIFPIRTGTSQANNKPHPKLSVSLFRIEPSSIRSTLLRSLPALG